MSAKALMPNQCTPLHFLYGKGDCCLCNEKTVNLELGRKLYDIKHELYTLIQAYKHDLLSNVEFVKKLEALEKEIPANLLPLVFN